MFTLILSSCSANIQVLEESHSALDSLLETKYSIIFIIHGNGDYLYHDNNNNKYEADEETLAEAIRIAKKNSYAEVFIFHQKPCQSFLFFFPLKDGEFYYYRNGQLIVNELYWRDQEKSNLNFEVDAYHRFSKANQSNLIKMFLYFGHEIPEFGGVGYDESYSDRTFTIADLTKGLNDFTSDSSKFDLTILAACFGGTPYTINKLGKYSRTIIASPENLHLSYFDLHSFEQLDINLNDGDVQSFANKIAQQSFEKFTNNLQTEVSVVVYNVEKVQNYLNSVQKDYDTTLSRLNTMTLIDQLRVDHCDCADIPSYKTSTINNGVDVYYRSARFGRSKNKINHSGWECWKY
ncbi:MAG: hypothetical protein IPJ23_10965 [Ignavibacteriales bacterium]|nr:hypothetical protein [Ignavibacteriales bacterium]